MLIALLHMYMKVRLIYNKLVNKLTDEWAKQPQIIKTTRMYIFIYNIFTVS